MPLTPQITVTGNLIDLTGVANAGSVTFELVNYGATVPRIQGTAIISNTSFIAQADGSGNFAVTLWGNDVITPSSTFYSVTYVSTAGSPIASVPYQFVGSGSFDLSQVIPIGQQVAAPQQPNSAIPQIFAAQTHQFLTGMNSLGLFSSAQPSFSDLTGSLTTSQIPTPTATTLGGVKSLAAISHRFITSIGTDGLPVAGQPAFSDISGTVAASQLPNPTATTLGGIQSLTAVASRWINTISTTGVPSATQPAFSDISGTVGSSQLPTPAASTLGGVKSLAAVSRKFVTSIGTDGGPVAAQPSAADLSDTATTGNVLRGNGTSFVSAQLSAADLSNTTTGTAGTAVVLATSPTLTGTALFKRLRATQGTALAVTDIGSLSGWGSTASVTSVSGTDMGGSVTISSSGTGQATNASFVLTFKDGTFTNAPIVLAGRGDLNTAGNAVATQTAATTCTFFWNATPSAGTSYTFNWITMGK